MLTAGLADDKCAQAMAVGVKRRAGGKQREFQKGVLENKPQRGPPLPRSFPEGSQGSFCRQALAFWIKQPSDRGKAGDQ